jgi:adenylate kinase family enzyme
MIATMDEHPVIERDLLLITGIPGTGKTCYGDKFAMEFGFVHHDIENQQVRDRIGRDPTQFIRELLNEKKNVVVTWGFHPKDELSLCHLRQFRDDGFKLIWFDGNRPAALASFQKRVIPKEIDFYRAESKNPK